MTATSGFVAWVIRKVTKSSCNHAFVYFGVDFIIEADAKQGLRYNEVSAYPDAVWSDLPLTDGQRDAVVQWSQEHLHTPYNYLDIAALLLALRFRWKAPSWALRRIRRPDRLICSEAVDLAYQAAGVKLFADGRPPSDVTPADLLGVIRMTHSVT